MNVLGKHLRIYSLYSILLQSFPQQCDEIEKLYLCRYSHIPESNYGYINDRNDRVIQGTQHIFDGQREIVLGKY